MNFLSTFREEITPRINDPLTGSWYPPVKAITDPLFANGIVLIPENQKPIVLCAIDWSEMSNESYSEWQTELALAANTEPQRVVIHCTHAHNTPWPDQMAHEIATRSGAAPLMNETACREALWRIAASLQRGLAQPKPLTTVRVGESKVEGIASNRRILGSDGKVKGVRWTFTRDEKIRNEPEGVIDPLLRNITFWSEKEKVASLSFYTTHPTSFDGDGLVTPDFSGLAREKVQKENPSTCYLYFTGCAGNITAGKYNQGNLESRVHFTEILYRAIKDSEKNSREIEGIALDWKTVPIVMPAQEEVPFEKLKAIVQDTRISQVERSRAALRMAYALRLHIPIQIALLSLNPKTHFLSLPGEAFVEYQLEAQSLRPDYWLATAAYADCGPGYIPLEKSFEEGGYEPTDSFVAPRSEKILKEAIRTLLKA